MIRKILLWALFFGLLQGLDLAAGTLHAGAMTEEEAVEEPDYQAALGLEGIPVPGAPPAGYGWGTADSVAASVPTDRVVWDRSPIRVVLAVGRERRIDFPGPVSVGLPADALPAGALRIQSVNGSLYLLASQPFSAVRVQVRERDSNFVYLLDLQARKDGPTTGLRIMRERPRDSAAAAVPARPAGNDPYVQLTRYAAQQLYGPERMIRALPGVGRVPVPRKPLALMHGGAVSAQPLISWIGHGHYVTAVKLVNTTDRPIDLDPRNLRGQWLSATFQHARLFPAGDPADTTCVYLVSRRPFAETVPTWLRVTSVEDR